MSLIASIQLFYVVLITCMPHYTCTGCDVWTEIPETNYLGGLPAGKTNTSLAACQLLCISNLSCTGIDYLQSAVDQPCWIHGPWTTGQNNVIGNPWTHYELDLRLCSTLLPSKTPPRTALPPLPPGCQQYFIKSENTSVNNSYLIESVSNQTDCETFCRRNPYCKGYDWFAVKNQCYLSLSLSQNVARYNGTTPGFTHYDLVLICTSTTSPPLTTTADKASLPVNINVGQQPPATYDVINNSTTVSLLVLTEETSSQAAAGPPSTVAPTTGNVLLVGLEVGLSLVVIIVIIVAVFVVVVVVVVVVVFVCKRRSRQSRSQSCCSCCYSPSTDNRPPA